MVAVAVQSVFRLEMHQDHIFFILKKIIFDISASKRSKNTKKILILSKKNSFFLEMQVGPRFQTGPKLSPINLQMTFGSPRKYHFTPLIRQKLCAKDIIVITLCKSTVNYLIVYIETPILFKVFLLICLCCAKD